MFTYDPTQWGIDADEFYAQRGEHGVADADSWNLSTFLTYFAYNVSMALWTMDRRNEHGLRDVCESISRTIINVEDSSEIDYSPAVRESMAEGFYGMLVPLLIDKNIFFPEGNTYTRQEDGFNNSDLNNLGSWILSVTARGFQYLIDFSSKTGWGSSEDFENRLIAQQEALSKFANDPQTYLTDHEGRNSFLNFIRMEFNRLWS